MVMYWMNIYPKSFILLHFRSLKLKISSTMVKYWMKFYQKSFILLHFRSLKLKIFFNHGEVNFYQKSFILLHFRSLNLNFFFNHGEVLNELLPKVIHSGAFQNSWIKNFLQPWCIIKWTFTKDLSFYCISDLLIWKFSSTIEWTFTQNHSFWCIPDLMNWKFSSTMV
jgi:hypothetical protein